METSKTKFSFIAIIFGLLVIFAGNTNAECPEPIDCPETPFLPGGYRQIPLSETCTLRYEFCYRHACGIYYDIFIGSLELIGDCEGFIEDIQNNLKTYIQYCADDATLNVNPWGAPETEIKECCPPSTQPPCWSDWIWRQGSFACYTDFFWDPVSQTFINDKCELENPSQCWDVCRYCFYYEYLTGGSAIKKYNKECQDVFWGQGCPEWGGPNGDLQCNPVCE